MQGVTDDHKTVIGYHGQQKDMQFYKENEKIHLGDANFISDGLGLCLNIK
jgi:hypothetical protein